MAQLTILLAAQLQTLFWERWNKKRERKRWGWNSQRL